MSSIGELPPPTAPLSERLRAAMTRGGYDSRRALALALGMGDGSLVGKWLNGSVRRIESERHLRELPRILGTPADYFRDDRKVTDRLAEVERRLGLIEDALGEAGRVFPGVAALAARVEALEAERLRGNDRGAK